MRKLLVGAAALVWFLATTPTGAADLRTPPIANAPSVATPTWSGPYLGVEGGLQSTRTDLTTVNIATVGPVFAPFAFAPGGATTLPYDATGFRFAAFGGVNWHTPADWVLGVEGDIGWADSKTTLGGVAVPALFCCATASFSSSVRTPWDASIRARIGYLVTPRFLVYLTGGVAWQHFEENSSCGAPFCGPRAPPLITLVPFAFTNGFTRVGWTVGGGVETMLWPNWLVRASYRYADFGTVTFSNTDVVTGGVAVGQTLITSTLDLKLRAHIASFGLAYKFGGDAVSASAAPIFYKAKAAPLASWSGFYAGLGAGLRSTRTDVTTTSAVVDGVPVDFTNFATSAPLNKASFSVGPYAGYNWQVAPQWVIGAEGDLRWADRTAELRGFPFTPGIFTSGIASDALAVKATWEGSARGRLGYLVTPTVLAYATGGAAWLHYDVTSSCPGLCTVPLTALAPTVIGASATKAGWTIGGGIETLLWDRWFARVDYRYADFGAQSFTLSRTGTALVASVTDNFDVKIRTHTAAFGIAYKFAD